MKLTPIEWRAILGACVDADGLDDDRWDDADTSRERRARSRALAKIAAALTTPSIRRVASSAEPAKRVTDD